VAQKSSKKWKKLREKQMRQRGKNVKNSSCVFGDTGGPRYPLVCYLRLVNCVQNFLSTDISLGIFKVEKPPPPPPALKNYDLLLFAILVFEGHSSDANTMNNEGCLYLPHFDKFGKNLLPSNSIELASIWIPQMNCCKLKSWMIFADQLKEKWKNE